jgi:hypothetical protein
MYMWVVIATLHSPFLSIETPLPDTKAMGIALNRQRLYRKKTFKTPSSEPFGVVVSLLDKCASCTRQ